MKKNIEKEAAEIAKRIARLPQVKAIYLFGSQVTGRARDDSDIDLVVITDTDSCAEDDAKNFEVIGYSNDKVDVSVFSRLPIMIKFRVLKEGRLLFSRDAKELLRIKVDVYREYLDYSSFIKRFYKRVIENV